MYKIGDKISTRLHTKTGQNLPFKEHGQVIFVNEKTNMYVVEFDVNGTKLRESFFQPERPGCPKYTGLCLINGKYCGECTKMRHAKKATTIMER